MNKKSKPRLQLLLLGMSTSHEFSTQELASFYGDFLIHGDMVYLTAGVSWIHGQVGAVIARWLAEGINTSIGQRVVDSLPGSGMKGFVNELGSCHPQTKYNDFQVGVPCEFLKKFRLVAPIVGEVAYKNESLHELLIEGSGWMNAYSDAEYCLLVRLEQVEGGFTVRLIVLEMTKSIDFEKAMRKPSARRIPVWVRLMDGVQPDNLTTYQLESLYDVKILYDGSFLFGQDDTNEQIPENLTLDLARVCDGSGLIISGKVSFKFDKLVERLNNIAKLMFEEYAPFFH